MNAVASTSPNQINENFQGYSNGSQESAKSHDTAKDVDASIENDQLADTSDVLALDIASNSQVLRDSVCFDRPI